MIAKMTNASIRLLQVLAFPRTWDPQAIDTRTVLLTWDLPANPTDYITGCTIEWSLDKKWQKSIQLSSSKFYASIQLNPQQTASTSVCTYNQPEVLEEF